MAVAHSNVLDLLGKYVSFQTDSTYLYVGVINNVVFNMEGSIEISIGWDDYYDFAEIKNLKILGSVQLSEVCNTKS